MAAILLRPQYVKCIVSTVFIYIYIYNITTHWMTMCRILINAKCNSHLIHIVQCVRGRSDLKDTYRKLRNTIGRICEAWLCLLASHMRFPLSLSTCPAIWCTTQIQMQCHYVIWQSYPLDVMCCYQIGGEIHCKNRGGVFYFIQQYAYTMKTLREPCRAVELFFIHICLCHSRYYNGRLVYSRPWLVIHIR